MAGCVLLSMRSASGFIGLTVSTIIGSLAIIAMSSWLNAAAFAGSAAVEQHLERTVREYQTALEQAHDTGLSEQALVQDVAARWRGVRGACRAAFARACMPLSLVFQRILEPDGIMAPVSPPARPK
jgi:type II secretory pathway pseudopilin PulG